MDMKNSDKTLADIEAINNLDIARMSLRWALERIQSLEKRVIELSRDLAQKETSAAVLEEERQTLKRELSLRKEDLSKRDEYYQRMQEFISIRLAGKPDAAAAAQRELELARMQEESHQRKLELEREYEARAETLRLEQRRLKAALEDQTRQQMERAAKEETARRVKFDEALAAQEAAFEDRKKKLEASIRLEMEKRIEEASALAIRQRMVAAEDWSGEKDSILKDQAEWQSKVEEQRKHLLLLEHALDRNQEALLEKTREAEAQKRAFENDRAAMNATLNELKIQADLWRQKSLEAHEGFGDAAKRSVLVEEERRKVSGELEEERARRQSAEKRAEALEATFKQRQSDLDAVETKLIQRLNDLQQELSRRDASWKEREEFLRKRDQDWHNQQSQWQRMMENKSDEIENLKRQLLETIQSYSKKTPGQPDQRKENGKHDSE